jgi:KaiC/GvpD/RAD55 family RecA-like ATPase
MSLTPVADIGPKWNGFEAVTFDGQFDTHIKTGEDYNVRTLASIFTMEPENHAKDQSPAFIPSCYPGYDAREHAVQRAQGCYVALTGDIDGGDHPLDQLDALLYAFAPGCAYLVYSSPNSRPGNRRWRIIMPLAETVSFDDWHDAQNALFNFMEHGGVQMDRALDRAAQPVFLPNVPEIHAKTAEPLRSPDGAPLYYERSTTGANAPGLSLSKGALAAGLHAIREKRSADDKAREQMRRDAEARKKLKPGDGHDIIAGFNRSNSIANLLELYNYQQSPRNADDWRSAYQEGESYATRIMGDKWVSLSMSDANAKVGETCKSGCFGDAYDLFVHYEHKGDHKAAFRALHAERRGSAPPPERYTYAAAEEQEYDPETGDPIYDDADAYGGADAERQIPRNASVDTPLPFEWAGKIAPVLDGLWLIEDWLPKAGIGAVYGHPGSGKSFFALDMAAHVASGQKWAGRHVERGLVVYVVAEGQTGFRNRLYAMQQAGQIAEDAPFVFIPTPIDLQSPEGDLKALMETIHSVVEQAGIPLALLVIDTLSKTFGAGKENTDDMASYVANCQRISSAFDCFTLVVHHRPKDSESRDLRGHSSLRGGIETTILIEAGDIKSATTLKQKDGEDNMVVRFKLERVVIGEDKRGKEISTCLTEIIDGDIPVQHSDPRDARKARLTGHKRMALKAIEDVVAASGREPPAEIPPSAIDRYRTWKAVDSALVRDRLQNEFMALSDNGSDKSSDNARRNTFRVLKDLKSAEILGSWGNFIWVN